MISSKNLKKLVIDQSLLKGSKFIFCRNIDEAFEILYELYNFYDYIKHGVIIIFVDRITEKSVIFHKDFAKYRELFVNRNLYFASNNRVFYPLFEPIICYDKRMVTFNYLKNEWEEFKDFKNTSILPKLEELKENSKLLII